MSEKKPYEVDSRTRELLKLADQRFREWLEDYLFVNDMSGAAFARMIGVTKGAVSHYRAGRKFPSFGTLLRIRAETGLDLNGLHDLLV